MIGDVLREIAVLWLALYPLERFKFEEANNWCYMAEVIGAGVVLLTCGMFLERKRISLSITEYPIE